MKIGGGPLAKNGVAGATPTAGLGVVEQPPCPREWSGHPQKDKKKKEKRKKEKRVKIGFELFGVVRPPARAWGGFGHPILAIVGGQSHLIPAVVGGQSPPRPLGVVRPPLWAWGWFNHS